MAEELSIWGLIVAADLVVQIVMVVLIIASIISWTLIFNKKSTLFKEKKLLKDFNSRFNVDKDLLSCFNVNSQDDISQLLRDSKKELTIESSSIEVAHRKLNLQTTSRVEGLEKNISTLATIASSSPYIGLFGTVWGIMHSFLSLASVKQATIAIVAPGIAEALIATAFGLFAAIPANIFYNKLTTQIEDIHNQYQNISQKFLVVMQREYLPK
jgi:biopolymer transport protein TolQ